MKDLTEKSLDEHINQKIDRRGRPMGGNLPLPKGIKVPRKPLTIPKEKLRAIR